MKDNKNNTWSRGICVMLLRRNIYTPYIYTYYIYIQQEVYKKDNKNNTWQGEMRDVSTCCLIVIFVLLLTTNN